SPECPHRLSDKLLKSSAAVFSLRRGVCILRFPAVKSTDYFQISSPDRPVCMPLCRVSGGAL
ncbi:hypothetical protein AW40_18695, partial [Kosakonia radicincitans UMEnt01/12]